MNVSDADEFDYSALVDPFLSGARNKDNDMGIRGRIIAYSYATVYEPDQEKREDYALELVEVLREIK